MLNRAPAGHAAAMVTIFIWGTTFISTKILLGTFTPVEILLIRFFIGYLALWCARPKPLALRRRGEEGYFAAAGLCGVALYYLLENIALTYTSASNVGVVISVAPFFTAMLSALFLGEKCPGARFFAGFLIAMGGIGLVTFGGGAALRVSPVGDLLAVAAAAVWAAYATLTRKISQMGYDIIQTTRRTFFYGLVWMLPVVGLMGFEVTPAELAAPLLLPNLLFLGLGASALCFVTWSWAVKLLGPVKTSVYIYMVPVITTAASALILGEQVTPAMLCGILLTLLGLLLSEGKFIKNLNISPANR